MARRSTRHPLECPCFIDVSACTECSYQVFVVPLAKRFQYGRPQVYQQQCPECRSLLPVSYAVVWSAALWESPRRHAALTNPYYRADVEEIAAAIQIHPGGTVDGIGRSQLIMWAVTAAFSSPVTLQYPDCGRYVMRPVPMSWLVPEVRDTEPS